jgi:hypothetical protein
MSLCEESARKVIKLKLLLMTNTIAHKSCPPYLIKFLSGAGCDQQEQKFK